MSTLNVALLSISLTVAQMLTLVSMYTGAGLNDGSQD